MKADQRMKAAEQVIHSEMKEMKRNQKMKRVQKTKETKETADNLTVTKVIRKNLKLEPHI